MATSTYIQISDYALLEYIYDDSTISSSKARPLRLENKYTNTYQFINNTQSINLTENVLDYTAARLGSDSSRWAFLDMDVPAPVVQINTNFVLKDLTSSLISSIKYDKVKLHFVAGYTFPGIDGVILEMQWRQWDINGDVGKLFSPATQVFVKGDDRINFSTNPMFVGDKFYDRYIEFNLPSLAEANFDFWNSPSASSTIGYQYTYNNVGFSETSQIYASLYEIDTTETATDGNRYFVTGQKFAASFNSSDTFTYINATVTENLYNDYIEYYPTWKGNFLEDYINLLNITGDWVIVNQIDVFEQIGSSFLKTFSMSSLQDDNFDAPASFRPIIKNSAIAISYTIDYTMRLMNKSDGQEIVRKATWTSTDVNKYGASLKRINVLDGYRPVKVYNKIVNASSDTVNSSAAINSTMPQIISQNIYVNSYYDVNFISVDSTTDITNTLGTTVYPQGMNTIFINKFDNQVKFKIFTKSADKKQNVTLDLSSNGMNVKLAFIMDDQTKYYIDPTQDITAANPGAGEVMFVIDDTLSTKLLGGKQRDYYIINKNNKGDEVLIYSGKFENQTEKSKVNQTNSQTMIKQLEDKVAALNAAQSGLLSAKVTGGMSTNNATGNNALASSSTANASLNTSKASAIAAAQQTLATGKAASSGVQQAIKDAANAGDTSTLNIIDIPGITQGMGANINSAMSPNVINPSKPSQNITAANISASALKQQNNANNGL